MRKTPLILLSGFLGSGKTTLLLRLLQETKKRGLKAGILMNELGKCDVDGVILQEETGISIERLLDGCVCCSKKDELAQSMHAVLDTKPDVIFVELTGVANPVEIVGMLSSAAFIGKISIKHMITVIDAEHALDYSSRFSSDKQLVQTLHQQLESANLVMINKADLVTSSERMKVEKMVRKRNPSASLLITKHASVDAGRLLDQAAPADPVKTAARTLKLPTAAPLERINRAGTAKDGQPTGAGSGADAETAETHEHHERHEHHEHHEHHGASFSKVQTFTLPCRADSFLDKEQVEQFLSLTPGQILRAKGYLNIEEEGACLLQYAGGRFNWQRSSYPGAGYIVLIGIDVDSGRTAERWQTLLTAHQSLKHS
ncbi:CobW family GTP-binding protein [Paenibacillus caui]|uniref:CobW family GTP-binding protein n=1 Tax=Paenibacillus caui TaxID=2873927 RepID=UPI001CA80B52|nr:GTP-binding protein [Paenibacillus caui]